MSESSNRFFMSLDDETQKYVDDTVEVINLAKRTYSSKTNRQAVIRAMIRYCKEKNPQFDSGYSKWVSVKDSKKSK